MVNETEAQTQEAASTEESAEDASEEQPKEPTVEELLERRPDLKSFVDERSEEAARRGEQRGKDRLAAEQRRQFHPERGQVQTLLGDLLTEVKDKGEVTKSLSDRFENLVTNAGQARIDQVAEEIPAVFFGEYEVSREAQAAYHEKLAAGDIDEALKALVSGAVASERVKLESEYDAKVQKAAEERAKQELESQSEDNGSAPPAVPRGGQGGGNPLMLTSAELQRTEWRDGLTQAQRNQVYANVMEADERFGADTIREGSLEAVRSFAAGQNSG